MSWLKDKIFGEKKPKKDRIVTAEPDSPEFAIHILNQLNKRHSPAVITFGSSTDQFVTMLLGVDPDHHAILLDEIAPANGNELVQSGDPFTVTASDHGIAVVFHTHVTRWKKNDKNVITYYAELPKSVEYCQRREAFRMKVSQAHGVTVHFNYEDQIIDDAFLLDISFLGLGIRIPHRDLHRTLLRDDYIEDCHFTIQNHTIHAKLKIRRTEYEEHDKYSTLGVQLMDISQADQRAINEFIIHLEREERKNETRDV